MTKSNAEAEFYVMGHGMLTSLGVDEIERIGAEHARNFEII